MTAYLVTGSDASLVSRAVSELLEELTGGHAGTTHEIEEYEPGTEGSDGGERGRFELGPVLAALSTPSWLSDHRVVVLRDAGALSSAQAAELAKLVAAPPVDNLLVLAAAGKAVPAALSKAVKAAGGRIVATDPGKGARARGDWFDEHLRRSSVHLDAAARHLLADHIGEDAARLDPLLDLLAVTYGSETKLSPAELEPLLGEQGGAPPWELTDAIDAGDGDRAIRALRRLLGPGGRHPLQVLAVLQRHVSGLLHLDGATDVRSPEDAASLLGMNAFPARKLLDQSRRLGHERIVRAVVVLADADADLRGRLAWPAELVMEVAVARLAQLSRATARPAQGRGASPSRPARASGGRRG